MHKNSRLITVVRFSGKRLYGGSVAARMKVCLRIFPLPTLLKRGRKTDSEDNTLSVPSAKNWARTPQTSPSPVTRSTVPSGSQSRRNSGRWTTNLKNDAPRSVGISKRTVNAASSSPDARSRADQESKNLRKWAAFNTHQDRHRKDGPWSHVIKKQSSTPSDQVRPLTKDKWPLPPHMAQPSNMRNSLPRPSVDSRRQDEHMRSSPERRKDSSLTAPAVTPQNSTNDASQRSLSRPDYSSFQIFRDHDDPRRALGRKRVAPERNTYHEYNRRETVVNKPLIKKSVKRKTKLIVRRKDVFIPTTLTVAMLARLLKVKLGVVYFPCFCVNVK